MLKHAGQVNNDINCDDKQERNTNSGRQRFMASVDVFTVSLKKQDILYLQALWLHIKNVISSKNIKMVVYGAEILRKCKKCEVFQSIRQKRPKHFRSKFALVTFRIATALGLTKPVQITIGKSLQYVRHGHF